MKKKKKKIVRGREQETFHTLDGFDVNLFGEEEPDRQWITCEGRRVSLFKEEEYLEMGFNIMLSEIDDFLRILEDIKKLLQK